MQPNVSEAAGLAAVVRPEAVARRSPELRAELITAASCSSFSKLAVPGR